MNIPATPSMFLAETHECPGPPLLGFRGIRAPGRRVLLADLLLGVVADSSGLAFGQCNLGIGPAVGGKTGDR